MTSGIRVKQAPPKLLQSGRSSIARARAGHRARAGGCYLRSEATSRFSNRPYCGRTGNWTVDISDRVARIDSREVPVITVS